MKIIMILMAVFTALASEIGGNAKRIERRELTISTEDESGLSDVKCITGDKIIFSTFRVSLAVCKNYCNLAPNCDEYQYQDNGDESFCKLLKRGCL